MADFSKYVPALSLSEGYGKFTNDPTDKGGSTMSGVTLNTFRAYYGASKTVDDLKAMTFDQWSHIMKSGYWDKCGCDKLMNQSVAEIIADFAINSGPKTAVKRVQALVGETVDGIAGPNTVRSINNSCQELLFNAIKEARKSYYHELVQKDPSQARFLTGWLNRISRFNFVQLLLFAVILITSCSPKIVEKIKVEQKDSIIVKVNERVVHDTVSVNLPVEVEKVVTRDTTSRLENTYALSLAMVSNGFLYHSLETKPQIIPVPVVVTVRDTSSFHQSIKASEAEKTIIKEKKLTIWQRIRLAGFWVLLAALVALNWKDILALIKKLWPIIKKLI